MQESENNSNETSPELSPEPSDNRPSPSAEPQGVFPANVSLREIQATWEMLVQFKAAIRENDYWPGDKLEAVAMGLSMITRMEAQYRVQVEMARIREKEQSRVARASIQAQGGTVNGATENIPS